MSPQAAVKFLADHGVDAWIYSATQVAAVSRYHSRRSGHFGAETIILPASLPQLKAWLGY